MDANTAARHFVAGLIEKQIAAVRLEKAYTWQRSVWNLETFEGAPPYLERFLETQENRDATIEEMAKLMEELRK